MADATGENLKCSFTLVGDNVAKAEITVRHAKLPSHFYRAVVQPDIQWKLQQVQDLGNFVLLALEMLRLGMLTIQKTIDEGVSVEKLLWVTKSIQDYLYAARDAFVYAPKKGAFAHVHEERLKKCFVPLPPADLTFNLYISSSKLNFNVIYSPAQPNEKDSVQVYECECHVPWFADLIYMVTSAIQLTQLFHDKGVSVEAVDPVFQTKMLDLLRQTSRPEMVVGWYHSHPGFGCWLSGVDINTQQSFEALSDRAVAVVIDPIQSVKGKVVIDAFRLINPQVILTGREPRQVTSNLGNLKKPSIQAMIHGLNRHYYSITVNYRMNELEQEMLLSLSKETWMSGLEVMFASDVREHNTKSMIKMQKLTAEYRKALEEEEKMSPQQLLVKNFGKQDPKRHLEETVASTLEYNIVQALGMAMNALVMDRRVCSNDPNVPLTVEECPANSSCVGKS